MSIPSAGPEAQNSLFKDPNAQNIAAIPQALHRATFRLQFSPSYVIVGVYRLCTDKHLYVPAWEKCRHGTQRGAVVGLIWTFLTFSLQKKFIEYFLYNSPRVTGLSQDTFFGYKIPFTLQTYAAFLLVGSQVSYILRFFLSRNMHIARDRVWDQTVASRGHGAEFWQPYVEEWDQPPVVKDTFARRFTNQWLSGFVGRSIVKPVLLLPFNLYPFVGILISAWFKGMGTAQHLHKKYFLTKKMTPAEIAVFVEERRWDYRTFGFLAALLEGLPFIGPFFTISNQVGAAMWAHDLEKRQHFVASQKRSKAL